MDTPSCKGCGSTLRSDNQSGYCQRSGVCKAARNKAWREANPESGAAATARYRSKLTEDQKLSIKAQAKITQAAKRWGISRAEAKAALDASNGTCDLCGQIAEPLHLDHDHETGMLRGWLCHHCNTGLGLFRDSPELLHVAAGYLRRSEAKWLMLT
jgi:hypothetical protein